MAFLCFCLESAGASDEAELRAFLDVGFHFRQIHLPWLRFITYQVPSRMSGWTFCPLIGERWAGVRRL